MVERKIKRVQNKSIKKSAKRVAKPKRKSVKKSAKRVAKPKRKSVKKISPRPKYKTQKKSCKSVKRVAKQKRKSVKKRGTKKQIGGISKTSFFDLVPNVYRVVKHTVDAMEDTGELIWDVIKIPGDLEVAFYDKSAPGVNNP